MVTQAVSSGRRAVWLPRALEAPGTVPSHGRIPVLTAQLSGPQDSSGLWSRFLWSSLSSCVPPPPSAPDLAGTEVDSDHRQPGWEGLGVTTLSPAGSSRNGSPGPSPGCWREEAESALEHVRTCDRDTGVAELAHHHPRHVPCCELEGTGGWEMAKGHGQAHVPPSPPAQHWAQSSGKAPC